MYHTYHVYYFVAHNLIKRTFSIRKISVPSRWLTFFIFQYLFHVLYMYIHTYYNSMKKAKNFMKVGSVLFYQGLSVDSFPLDDESPEETKKFFPAHQKSTTYYF